MVLAAARAKVEVLDGIRVLGLGQLYAHGEGTASFQSRRRSADGSFRLRHNDTLQIGILYCGL
jgi:hypothetical protein